MTLCFATNNGHKLQEVRAALGGTFSVTTLADIKCFEELPETSDTLEGNSFQKAEYVLTHFGIPCFADDSGLEVEALGGEPGVYSAMYAGPQRNSEDNIHLLLQKLNGITNRRARFRTVFTLVGIEKTPLIFQGSVDGRIISERRGTAGFGYDPVFIPDGYEHTFAEMPIEQKNQLSHRSIALRKLTTWLATSGRV